MGDAELTVLVVDDDFRVANMHAGIVNALPGFTVSATVNTLAAAREAEAVDLALVDVYLPDGSGVDFVRELRCDSFILSAATEAETIRAAVAAGALSYLVKPFVPADLAARLAGYARYRKILSGANLSAQDVDAALDALRPKVAAQQMSVTATSPTKQLVLKALRAVARETPIVVETSADDIGPAAAQRYLATLAAAGEVKTRLRYGTTGRPEQEFVAAPDAPATRRTRPPPAGA